MMAREKPDRRTMRTYTVVALLGIFVGAALLALAARLLPGRPTQFVGRILRRGGHQDDSAHER
jgi:ABC-type lipoprotein release transport system permease subunit